MDMVFLELQSEDSLRSILMQHCVRESCLAGKTHLELVKLVVDHVIPKGRTESSRRPHALRKDEVRACTRCVQQTKEEQGHPNGVAADCVENGRCSKRKATPLDASAVANGLENEEDKEVSKEENDQSSSKRSKISWP